MLIDLDDFISTFQPMQNEFNQNASFDGCMFETYGKELEHVCYQ